MVEEIAAAVCQPAPVETPREDEWDLRRRGCMACGSTKVRPLFGLERDGVPPAQPGHNTEYRHLVVVGCGVCHWGHRERRRHDCFNWEDVWDNDDWWPIDTEDMARLRGSLSACPAPLTPECRCPVHRTLRASCSQHSTSNILPSLGWDYGREVPRLVIHVDQGLPSFRPRSGPVTMWHPISTGFSLRP